MVLQLPPSAPKRVIQRESQLSVSLILAWRAVDIDFSAVRKGEMNPNFEQPARVVMFARRFHAHMTGGYAVKQLLQTCHLVCDFAGQRLGRLQTMVVNL
jgi:hypothetical protein